jgi:site-specific DNA-cytosine methylase
MDNMKILVACEESQAVTIELRKLGHEAYSNDLIECSGGHPEWHIKGDVLNIINKGWDMIIAFPPCTYLTLTGNRWFNIEKYGDKAIQRHKDRVDAIDFFNAIIKSDCEKIVVENPIGVMSSKYRKPDQIIHPYMFGYPTTKATCLWLKGASKLTPTDIVEKGEVVISRSGNRMSRWYYDTSCLPHADRAKARSKTFPGIAKAMAEQWAGDNNE